MTSSQPPQGPEGFGQPTPGQQPGYGQQPAGSSPYGQPQPQQPAYGQQPPAAQPYGQPQPQQSAFGQQSTFAGQGRSSSAIDVSKVKLFDWLLVGGWVLMTVFMIIPWFSFEGFGDSESTNGFSDSVQGFSVGYTSGLMIFAWILFLLAALWAVASAIFTIRLPFPRHFVTAGLAGLGFIFTLITWISTFSLDDQVEAVFDVGFSVMAFLTFLLALAMTAVAVLSLLPELKAFQAARRSGGHGGHGGQGFGGGQQFGQAQAPQQQYGQQQASQQQYGQPQPPAAPTQQYGQPPAAPTQQYGQPPAAPTQQFGQPQQPYSPPPPPPAQPGQGPTPGQPTGGV